MIQKQILGTIRFALPILLVANIYPALLAGFTGHIFCALLMGAYICYLNWVSHNNLITSLKYSPTGNEKEFFDTHIKECGIDPTTIVMRYAYTNGAMGMTAGNTVIIDPVVWHGIDNDPEAVKVKDIFIAHIQPTLSPIRKDLIQAIHAALTPTVQRFIIKHELGHVFYNFSYKKLFVIFCTGTLATYSGIATAMALLPINGLLALLAGICVGGTSDLLYTYLFNGFWKVHEEKKADAFAVRYCSTEEVIEAAHFFARFQELVDAHKEPDNALNFLPQAFASGHQHGKTREAYLLHMVRKHKNQLPIS